jgi:hypothetical protein
MNGKNSEVDVEVVCEAFRSNNIHGPSLSQLNDTDWSQLIEVSFVMRRNSQKIQGEEIATRTSLFCKGRPAKQVEEVTA